MGRFVIFLAIAVATFAYLSSGGQRAKYDAVGTWQKIAAVEIAGCGELKPLDKLNAYLDQNDAVAYQRGLGDAMRSGECILLTSGQEVYVLDSAKSKVRLRIRGDTSEYWASRRALEEPQAQ